MHRCRSPTGGGSPRRSPNPIRRAHSTFTPATCAGSCTASYPCSARWRRPRHSTPTPPTSGPTFDGNGAPAPPPSPRTSRPRPHCAAPSRYSPTCCSPCHPTPTTDWSTKKAGPSMHSSDGSPTCCNASACHDGYADLIRLLDQTADRLASSIKPDQRPRTRDRAQMSPVPSDSRQTSSRKRSTTIRQRRSTNCDANLRQLQRRPDQRLGYVADVRASDHALSTGGGDTGAVRSAAATVSTYQRWKRSGG